jgi:AraC-like DNA-binding protein
VDAGEGEDPQLAYSGVDPLSDVLDTVSLNGSVFFLVDATSPWSVHVPETAAFSHHLFKHRRHIISYHVVVKGRGFACVPGAARTAFDEGDIIVFPHGDAYVMESAPGATPEFDRDQMRLFFKEMAAGRLPFTVTEGGGEEPRAQFVCGFLGCDASPFNPLLDHLPRLLRIRQPEKADDLLRRLLELTLIEARMPCSGGDSVRRRLSELLFVEVIRRHLATLPESEVGWLQGLRDPVVGRALARIHATPGHGWTLESLASQIGTSRSVLAERFTALIGHAPMRYLSRWRMQLAARKLADTNAKISAIALEVGYASEAAFSRAFKKVSGASPQSWRKSAGASRGAGGV